MEETLGGAFHCDVYTREERVDGTELIIRVDRTAYIGRQGRVLCDGFTARGHKRRLQPPRRCVLDSCLNKSFS